MTIKNFIKKRYRTIIPMAILLIGLTTTLMTAQTLHETEQQRTWVEYNAEALGHVQGIQNELLHEHLGLVHAVQAYYDASKFVDPSEFKLFSQRILEHYDADDIEALEWAPKVIASERELIEQKNREWIHPEFSITEINDQGETVVAGRRDHYFPVTYIYPYNGNETALGLDLLSEATRREALQRAVDLGETAVTGPLNLVQDRTNKLGFLTVSPVYKQGMPTTTTALRRKNIMGVVLGVFNYEEVLLDGIGENSRDKMDIIVGEVTDPKNPSILLHHSFNSESDEINISILESPDKRPTYSSNLWRLHHSLKYGGRDWVIVTEPTPAYLKELNDPTPTTVLITGLLLTLLLTVFYAKTLQSQDRTQQLTHELQKESLERERDRALLKQLNEELESRVSDRTSELEKQQMAAMNLAQDASESSRASIQLEKKFRAVLESAPDAMVIVNREGKIVLINKETETLFGYSRNEILEQQIHQFIPRKYAELYEHNGMNKEDPTRMTTAGDDVYVQTRAGTKIPVEISLSPIETEEELLTVSAIRDITERKKSIVALRESEQRFRSVIESAQDAIISTNSEGLIISWNTAAKKLFGYSEPEAMGQHITTIIPKTYWGKNISGMKEFAVTGKWDAIGKTTELIGTTKNNHEIPIELTLSAWKTAAGVFFTIIIRDISARKRSDLDLRRSNEELEQFAYVASHDLKEPLRKVRNFAELLSTRYEDHLDEKGQHFIDYIVDGAVRMENLINDLLTYSRAGRKDKATEPTDLGKLVDKVLSDLKNPIDTAQAKINIGSLPTLDVNPVQMSQLFQNLLGNALKFKGEKELEINVTAELSSSKNWLFTIKDNGIGIDSRFSERIFAIFQRLHTRSEYDGSGIGLSVCKKIVERHGGKIWAEPGESGGTTFSFTIPVNPSGDTL